MYNLAGGMIESMSEPTPFTASEQPPVPVVKKSTTSVLTNAPLKDGASTYSLYKSALEETGNTTQNWENLAGNQRQAWNELLTLSGRKMYFMWQYELSLRGESSVAWNDLVAHQQQTWNNLASVLAGAPSPTEAAADLENVDRI